MSTLTFFHRPAAAAVSTTRPAQHPARFSRAEATVLRDRRTFDPHPGLWAAQRKVTELHRMYRENDYRGQPEAMLKEIQAAEAAVRRLKGVSQVR